MVSLVDDVIAFNCAAENNLLDFDININNLNVFLE